MSKMLVVIQSNSGYKEYFIDDTHHASVTRFLDALVDTIAPLSAVELLQQYLLEDCAEEMWSAVFGSAGDSFSWWNRVSFMGDADWDKPGEVWLGIEDPEDPTMLSTVEKKVTLKDVAHAVALCEVNKLAVDPCTGRLDLSFEQWDACIADAVMQILVLGEVVYA